MVIGAGGAHVQRSKSWGVRVYADHAATTPLRPEAFAAMEPFLGMRPCNASALHAEGRRARAALDDARATVARLLGARPREIVFTGSGSEANNLALLGAARARYRAGAHVVTVITEHPAVLRALEALQEHGVTITTLEVGPDGLVSADAFAAAIRPETVLASVMLANNEIGTLQPIARLAGIARKQNVLFHTDAVQAAGRMPLDVDVLGVDLLSLSGHKFYGPQGVGALYVRTGTPLSPVLFGGGQEGGLRPGTENVAGIAGFSAAFQEACFELATEAVRVAALRARFEAALPARVPGIRINAATAPRAPHISSVAFDGVDAQALLAALDLAGVAVSAGSACASGSSRPSYVLTALGAPDWVRRGTLRFSFGKLTDEENVERLVQMVAEAAGTARVVQGDMGTFHSGSVSSRSEVHS